MLTYALGFPLLEDRALMGMERPRQEFAEYARWVLAAGEQLMVAATPASRRKRRR